MSEEISRKDLTIWKELVKSSKRYGLARLAFFRGEVNRVALIKRALHTDDWSYAVGIAKSLSIEEHMQLFDEWVRLMQVENFFPAICTYILSLPREWVLERIEQAVEPHLLKADDRDFRYYLSLYCDLDHNLAMKLAQRALEHQDEEIKEVGKEFLSVLEEDQSP